LGDCSASAMLEVAFATALWPTRFLEGTVAHKSNKRLRLQAVGPTKQRTWPGPGNREMYGPTNAYRTHRGSDTTAHKRKTYL
jgi:hypothetical protein